MKRSVIFVCMLLAGCGGYTASDLENARIEGYTEEELNDAYEEGQEEGYEEGHEVGYEEGYIFAEEVAQEEIEMAYDEGYVEGMATSQDNLSDSTSILGEISNSSDESLGTFGTPNIEMDGYDWGVMIDYDKRDLIEAIAENNGEYLSWSDVDSIIYLIDGFYENGGKYKTVGEVLEELH